MKIQKFNEQIKIIGEDIEKLYIYSILTKEEELSQDIKENDDKMERLMLYVESASLISKKRLGLSFICDVAMDYLDEILSNEMDTEEFEVICEESLYSLD